MKTPEQVLTDFEAFSKKCEVAEYTDTGEAWYHLETLAEVVRNLLEVST